MLSDYKPQLLALAVGLLITGTLGTIIPVDCDRILSFGFDDCFEFTLNLKAVMLLMLFSGIYTLLLFIVVSYNDYKKSKEELS